MADPQLLEEIQKGQNAGVSDDVIRNNLIKAGWDSEDVTGALAVSHIPRISSAIPAKSYTSFVVKPQHRLISLMLVLMLCALIGGEVYVYEARIPITLTLLTSLPYISTLNSQ